MEKREVTIKLRLSDSELAQIQERIRMERIHYTSFDQIPVVINADCLAIVLGISRTTAYQLMHSDAFPTFRIGSRIVCIRRSPAAAGAVVNGSSAVTAAAV